MANITALYSKFSAACIAIQEGESPPNERAFDRAVTRAGGLASRIVKSPARNIDEILIKIKVSAWRAECSPLDELDGPSHRFTAAIPLPPNAART